MVIDPLPCCPRRGQTRQIGQAVSADACRGHVSPASVHLLCLHPNPSLSPFLPPPPSSTVLASKDEQKK